MYSCHGLIKTTVTVPDLPTASTSALALDSSDKENQPAKKSKAVKDGTKIFRPSKVSLSARWALFLLFAMILINVLIFGRNLFGSNQAKALRKLSIDDLNLLWDSLDSD